MMIKDIRERYGLSRAEFCRQLNIPIRTVEDWEAGKRKPPEYLIHLIKFYLEHKEG